MVEKGDSIECLVLGCSRDFEGLGKVGEKLVHLAGAHLERVSFIVEEDKPFYPMRIGLARMRAQVAKGRSRSDLIEEFRFR